MISELQTIPMILLWNFSKWSKSGRNYSAEVLQKLNEVGTSYASRFLLLVMCSRMMVMALFIQKSGSLHAASTSAQSLPLLLAINEYSHFRAKILHVLNFLRYCFLPCNSLI